MQIMSPMIRNPLSGSHQPTRDPSSGFQFRNHPGTSHQTFRGWEEPPPHHNPDFGRPTASVHMPSTTWAGISRSRGGFSTFQRPSDEMYFEDPWCSHEIQQTRCDGHLSGRVSQGRYEDLRSGPDDETEEIRAPLRPRRGQDPGARLPPVRQTTPNPRRTSRQTTRASQAQGENIPLNQQRVPIIVRTDADTPWTRETAMTQTDPVGQPAVRQRRQQQQFQQPPRLVPVNTSDEEQSPRTPGTPETRSRFAEEERYL